MIHWNDLVKWEKFLVTIIMIFGILALIYTFTFTYGYLWDNWP